MNWDQPYVVSKNLIIQPVGRDAFEVSGSISSSSALSLSSSALDLLSCFSQPACMRDVEEYASELGVERTALEASVASFVASGFVIAAGEDAPTVAHGGFSSLRVHHAMLRDQVRVMAYRAAINATVRDKTVLEIGCGTGILSVLAAQAGARHVHAIEETKIADVAERMFAANDVADKVTLHRGNSLDIELPEKADLLIHELIDTDPVSENIRRYLVDAKERLLKPDAVLLPNRLSVCCRGVHNTQWTSTSQRAAELAEAATAYGVSFQPFVDAMAHVQPSRRIHHQLPIAAGGLLTGERVLYDFDFADPAFANSDVNAGTLDVKLPGTLNAVVVYFRAYFPSGTVLTNSPLATPTCWGFLVCDLKEPLVVSAGERVPYEARIEMTGDGERMFVHVARARTPTKQYE